MALCTGADTYDPQGSLVQRQGNNGSGALDTASFDAYGKPLGDVDTGTGAAETYSDPVGFGGQFGYRSDAETGLSLLGHRYYDGKTGRFLSRDPIGYGGGLNLYGFAGNNPINNADPDGTNWFTKLLGRIFLGGGGLKKGTPTLNSNAAEHRREMQELTSVNDDGSDTVDSPMRAQRIYHQDETSHQAYSQIQHVYGIVGSSIASAPLGGEGAEAETTVTEAKTTLAEAKQLVGSWARTRRGRTGYTRADSIAYHFAQHGTQVGASDVLQYMRKAKSFSQQLRRIKPTKVIGDIPGVMRYRNGGKYIDIAPGGESYPLGRDKSWGLRWLCMRKL